MKTKRFFKSFLALFLPWVIFLVDDNPIGAAITIVAQATIIGWVPASIWAWRIVHHPENINGSGNTIDN
ncbi:MAG: YqaE/Pmp3 family membrane protein [Legionella sp.]